MSVMAMTWAFAQQIDDARAKLVLLALADHADDNGYCWPTIARILAKAGGSRGSLFEKFNLLESANLITRRSGKDEQKRQKKNRYLLNLDGLPPHDLESRVQDLDSEFERKIQAEPSPENSQSRVQLSGLQENHHRTISRKNAPNGAVVSLFPDSPPGKAELRVPKKVPRRRAQTEWPDGLQLEARHRQAAAERGLRDAERIWQNFHDYHQAKGSRFADWDAAWRTWLNKAVEFSRSSSRPGNRDVMEGTL